MYLKEERREIKLLQDEEAGTNHNIETYLCCGCVEERRREERNEKCLGEDGHFLLH